MKFRRSGAKAVLSALVVGAVLAASAPGLHAAVTFLNTQWVSSSEQYDLQFTNQVTSATFDTVNGGTAVYATLESNEINGSLNPQLQGPLAAHVFIAASTTTPATPLGPYLSQPLNIPSGTGTIQILLDTPVNGMSNLLTVQFNAGILGMTGGSAPVFWGQDGLSGETVTFSSDFLNFNTTSGNAFSWEMTNATPPLQQGDGGFLASFAGNGLSSYSATTGMPTVVPEPGSFGLLLLGGVACAGLVRRRTR